MPQESLESRASKRLDARDVRLLALWLLAALAGVGVAYHYFFQAFPEAAVEFKVTRAQALNRAHAFATAQGAQFDGYESTITFRVDDQQKIYLEREVGLQQANRLMSSEVNVWYWNARFFKPLQKEEFRVGVDPSGRIVKYDQVLEEGAPGAHLSRAEALERAEQFLRDTLQKPLEAYTFLREEANSFTRPNRTDWSFTWERSGFRAQDAPYRLRVTLHGDGIGGYEEFLKVPEAWQRDFARMRSSNEFLTLVAAVPYALLLGGALAVLLALGRRGQTRWRSALKLGLFIAALYFITTLNQWPLTRASYDTNSAYSSFVVSQMALAMASSVLLALLVVIAVLPGEPIYRAGQPDRLRLNCAFTLHGLRTKEFFRSGVIGICLAGAHIGYVVLFYVAGRRFGVWAPQDLQYSDTLSTVLPWIYPLTIGIYAAVSEEFLFRLFAIRFLLRATKSKFLAIVLPALAWGFLHANYPQEPGYIRGIEVGLIGIVAGMVMLRWGIVATLIWHFAVDAFLISLPLMRSGDLYGQISGTLVGLGVLIPVGIAGVLYLVRGGFADQTELLNRAEPLVEAPPAPVEEVMATRLAPTYKALKKPALAMLAVCGALGALLLWVANPRNIGDFVRFSVDARQAEALADGILRQRQMDPSNYHRTATVQYTFNPLVNEFLRRSIGVEAANRTYSDQVPPAFWTVRYFRDSQKEEYLVVLRPDGALHSVHHTLAEAAPGPSLGKEDALARAEAFLHESKGLDLTQWRVVETTSNRLPARTDHRFTWEQTAPLAATPNGEESAHVRVELRVQGEELSHYRTFVHVSEDWMRKQAQTTLAGTAQLIGLSVFVAAFAMAVLVVFFRNLKQRLADAVPWRRLAGWSLAVLAATVVTFAMGVPQFLFSYSTDQPFHTFLGRTVIELSLGAGLRYALVLFLFGLAWFFLTRAHGAERLPGWRGMPPLYYRDAFLVALGGSLALIGLGRLPELAGRIWPVLRHAFPARVPQELDFSWPAAYVLGNAVTYSFITIGVLALALGFASCYLRRPCHQASLLAGLAVVTVSRWGSLGDLVQQTLIVFASLAVIWWGSRRIVRFNLLGYFLAGMLALLASPAADFLRQPNPFFRANGWVVIAAMAALLIWPFAVWRSSTGEADAQVPGRAT